MFQCERGDIEWSNVHATGPTKRKGDQGAKQMFEEMGEDNFSNLLSSVIQEAWIQEACHYPTRRNASLKITPGHLMVKMQKTKKKQK